MSSGWMNGFKPSMLTAARPLTGDAPGRLSTPSSSTVRFISLCTLWYTTSALSSNTGKAILNQFRYPVTLTLVQFAFVSLYCVLFMSPLVRFTHMRRPNRAILRNTVPMGLFQVGGHMFSSIAISRIPVSTVHTIKALSPLFTVAAYALLFGVSYSARTYVSLLPLTIGVMLACSFDMSASNFVGLMCAFGSALVFVSSNIFFKKVMPSPSSSAAAGATPTSHKLDKLNLLFYSSTMAFIFMLPIWIWTDLPVFLTTASADSDYVAHPAHAHAGSHGVTYYFFMNGTVHFAQNIIAFIILSSTSPVTYSIASLIKRVAVICIAIVWFSQTVHPIQALGIMLTFVGLWMYNNSKSDVERGENKMRRVEAARGLMLPRTRSETRMDDGDMSFVPEASVPVSGLHPQFRNRPRAPTVHMPQPTAQELHQYTSHITIPSNDGQHYHPNLHIKVMPPTEQYPSPPLSLDSPPGSPPREHVRRI